MKGGDLAFAIFFVGALAVGAIFVVGLVVLMLDPVIRTFETLLG